ncbi:MAG TPA: hydrogen peroxide-dependent heme synthase [Vicinamibacteria bacterium]|nr:hydrogen peroxide-dependent heme synthase [Vicinamibacteria bacterium]
MHDPRVPETLEGYYVLHQMFRIHWEPWRALQGPERKVRSKDTIAALEAMDRAGESETAVSTLLGHRGDLMLVHLRRDLDALQAAQIAVSRLPLAPFLELTTSYVSVVELGLYEMTAIIHSRLNEQGLATGSQEFEQAFDAALEEQRRRVSPRLYPQVPRRRAICFYPMNKRRGEVKNWYAASFADRARLMRDHGLIGRHYAGQVTQIISGSIGFDDWEWGVDLFADDPLVFKKLVYEMRFDEASSWYGEFGPFFVGLQFSKPELCRYLEGEVPALLPEAPAENP